MIIDCVSDLHGFYPKLEGGDLLIIAGDLTAADKPRQFGDFKEWLSKQPYKKIVLIAGNHDGLIEKRIMMGDKDSWEHPVFSYLEDSGTQFEGLKIWGAPWTPPFCDWHFMLEPEEIKKKWDMIPADTDILVTHGPPYGVLDKVQFSSKGDKLKHAGCKELMKQCVAGRLNLKVHVFGHIHEGYGTVNLGGTQYVNCAHVDQDYRPVNQPIRVIL